MSVKLYVGNLPYRISNDDLSTLFSQYGQVEEASVVMDRQTNRSRGFGFVTMSEQSAADAAIEALHGQDYQGRNLVVNVARPPKPREDRGGYSRH